MRGKPVMEVNAEAGQRTEGSDLTQGCEWKRLPAKGNVALKTHFKRVSVKYRFNYPVLCTRQLLILVTPLSGRNFDSRWR